MIAARRAANRSMPASTVIPVLGYPDVAAAAWLCDVFGFSVRLRIGDHRVQLNVGDGAVVVAGATAPPQAHAVMVRIDDVHRHHLDAVAAGAAVLSAPADFPYGERQYTVRDPAGHVWTFSQSIADVDPAEWGGVLETP
jgi:uncharacterized glyoxalase superfamily protein PhnB